MSNLTYNPNINMDFDTGGNFRNNNSYDTPQLLQSMDPRAPMQPMRQPMMQQMQPMRQPMMQQYDNYEYDEPPVMRTPKRQKTKENVDKFSDTKSTRFDWILIIKKIIIYTALFLIMSHVKMDELVCKFIPFLSDNQILCMTFKGILLAIIIIIIQAIL